MIDAERTYRAPSRWAALVFGIAFVVLAIAGLFLLSSLGDRAFYALVGAYGVGLTIGVFRARLTVTTDEVVYVRGVLGQRKVAWGEIDAFSSGGSRSARYIVIRLRDGSTIRCRRIATSRNWKRGRDLLNAWLTELNAMVTARPAPPSG